MNNEQRTIGQMNCNNANKDDNILRVKTKAFAIRIVNLYKYLRQNKEEWVLSKQVLRSGTSIGANLTEGIYGQSKADFIAKLYISLKEAGETEYWIELLSDTGYISEQEKFSLILDLKEILRLLTASIKTAKKSSKNQPKS